jgi:hypothetical protein
LREAKLFGKPRQPAVFLAFHSPARGGLTVIVAEQMQNAVGEVTDDFGLPGCLELFRL